MGRHLPVGAGSGQNRHILGYDGTYTTNRGLVLGYFKMWPTLITPLSSFRYSAFQLLGPFPERLGHQGLACISYGPRPLKSTWRHGPFWGLVTCDMGLKKIVTWDMDIS